MGFRRDRLHGERVALTRRSRPSNIFRTRSTEHVFEELVGRFRSPVQDPWQNVEKRPEAASEFPM